MNPRLYRVLQSLLVAALALYLLERLVSGKLYWYINERFTGLVLAGLLGLLLVAGNALLALYQARREHAGEHAHHHDHDHVHGHDHDHNHGARPAPWNLLWLALPLVLGLLVPARPLGSDLAANKGVTLGGALTGGSSQPAQLVAAPDERNVLDWLRLFNASADLTPYLGESANVIGFVYPDPRLPEGYFLVARFSVACCVADAFAIGMAVAWSEELPPDQWVNVRGPVQVLEVDGQPVPLILAERIDLIAEPAQPYIFP